MTEPTSTRNDRTPQTSFFKQYLRYSLDKNKIYLLAGTVLALLAIPLFVIITEVFYVRLFSAEEYNYSIGMTLYYLIMFVGASYFGLYILALTGGTRCFEVLTRRHKTDTLMCLPLNHSQRFWGDFLTGYITGVAPIIPAGLVGIIIGAIAQGSHPTQHFAKLAFLYALTIFFLMTFAYTLSVLAAALCGNISGGIVTSVLLAVISIGLTECWSTFFTQCIVGFPITQYPEINQPVPSITFIPELLGVFGTMDLSQSDGINLFLECPFAVRNPLNVIFYILLPAGFTALACFIAKHRKPEHGGEVFAAKYGAVAVTVLLIITAIGGVCCLFIPKSFNWVFVSISCIIASVVICVAVELILRRGVKNLGRRVIVYAVTTVVSIGILVLINETHALGMTFYLPSADKIQSVEYTHGGYNPVTDQYDVSYKFDQKSDIEKFRESHAALLNENIGVLTTNRYKHNGNSDTTNITYTLENGKTFIRTYLVSYRGAETTLGEITAMEALRAMPALLESYPPQYAAPLLSEKIRGSEVSLGGTFGNLYIFPEDLPELSQILHDDIVSRYSPDSQPIGSVTFFTETNDRSFDILETYENTLAFIRSNALYADDTAFSFKFSFDGYTMSIDLTREDMASPAGKELTALMKSCRPSDFVTRASEEYQTGISVSSPDYFYWYIPQSNMPKVTALITQIAAERS